MAFYHWQTALTVDSLEQAWLTQTQADRLYVKFFDVDWNFGQQAAIPKAVLQVNQALLGLDIVPTIFITNRTFQQLPVSETPVLAKAILDKIEDSWPQLHPLEIQLDCDWTGTTRETYFAFLTAFKNLLPKTSLLSVTVRLHQYRYPKKTGIPPADRAMLMYYNMGELSQWEEPNSILNLMAAAPYLAAEAYPLPLDLALPLYRWGVLFREGKMIKLINGLSAEDLIDPAFEAIDTIDSLGSSRWRVRESTYLQGYYLYAGDLIRLEWITPKLLQQAHLQLKAVTHKGDHHLSFYHLDEAILKDFTVEDILTIIKEEK